MRRVALLCVLLLMLAGCGRGRGGGDAAPTETPSPETLPSETQGASDQQTADSAESVDSATAARSELPTVQADLSQLSSYRATASWTISRNGEQLQSIAMRVAETQAPRARRVEVESSQGEFGLVQSEDAVWVQSEGQWQQIPAAGADMLFDQMANQMLIQPEALAELASAEAGSYDLVGEETVNGVATRHYRFDLDPGRLPQTIQGQGVDGVRADFWVANEAELPVVVMRMELAYTGIYDGEEEADFAMRWELSEVNQEISVEMPK